MFQVLIRILSTTLQNIWNMLKRVLFFPSCLLFHFFLSPLPAPPLVSMNVAPTDGLDPEDIALLQNLGVLDETNADIGERNPQFIEFIAGAAAHCCKSTTVTNEGATGPCHDSISSPNSMLSYGSALSPRLCVYIYISVCVCVFV